MPEAAPATPPAEPAQVPLVMWEGAGLVRDAEGLGRAVALVGDASRRLELALAAASPRAGGNRRRLRSWRGWSRARRSAAKRAAVAIGVRTFPRATIGTGRSTSPTDVPFEGYR